jgi:hypothetical protein
MARTQSPIVIQHALGKASGYNPGKASMSVPETSSTIKLHFLVTNVYYREHEEIEANKTFNRREQLLWAPPTLVAK